METTAVTSARPREALVIEHDPLTRHQLVDALTGVGYGVRICSSLAEGRENFARQGVVVTHANGDSTELRGFVAFVRHSAGREQPYILAVGEADSPSGLSRDDMGLDDFLCMPIDAGQLADQVRSIASHRQPTDSPVAKPSAPPVPTRPEPHAATDAAVLGHFCPVLIDQVPLALALFDTEMRYLVANRRFVRDFGLTGQSIVGRSHYELFPDLHPTWRGMFDRALQGGEGRIDEDLFRRADGSSDWVRWEVRPWYTDENDIGGVVLSQEVITDQKRADRRRRFEKNLASSLFESPTMPVLLVALDGRVLRSSPAARRALGLQPTVDGRLPFWEIYPDATSEAAEKFRFQRAASEWPAAESFAFQPADIEIPGATPQVLHWTASPHRSPGGTTEAVLLTGSLADRLPARPQAAASPPQAPRPEPGSDVGHLLPFGLVVLDRDGRVSYANEPVAALFARPLNQSDDLAEWLAQAAPDDVQREPILREWRDNVWRRQLTRVFSLCSADGLLKEIEVRPRLLTDGRLLVVLSDVTETHRNVEALRTSEAKYRGLFREFPVGIALADRTGAIVETNPALEKMAASSRIELRREHLQELLGADDSGPAQPEDDGRPMFLRQRSGERLPVTVTFGPICNPAGAAVLQACLVQPRRALTPAEPPLPPPAADAPLPAVAVPDTAVALDVESRSPDTFNWRDLAFAHLRTAILVTDLRGRIRAANPAATQFFGVEPDGLIGMGLYHLFRPTDPAGFSREVSERINLFRRWEEETDYHREDGTQDRCRAEVMPVTGGPAPGLLCVVQPIFTAAPSAP